MRAVLQRVKRASISIGGMTTAAIGPGLVILLGIKTGDTADEAKWLVDKIVNLRIFEDAAGKMNVSLADTGGEMLIVSQFTLYGDCRKGRRPGFSAAAPPAVAEPLYDRFVELAQASGLPVATGIFQAEMEVELINDGPVTLVVDAPTCP